MPMTDVLTSAELALALEAAARTARAHDSGWTNAEERAALKRARDAIEHTLAATDLNAARSPDGAGWRTGSVIDSLHILASWLVDTAQDEPLSRLRAIDCAGLGSADAVTLGELIDADHALRGDDPEWDTCEDCMGSGGHRDAYGEGTCSSCGGRGRMPGNEAAREQAKKQEQDRQDAIYRDVQRAYEYGEDWR